MTVRELDTAPNLLRLYAKAAVTSWSGGEDLPEDRLRLPAVEIDRDHLAAYDRVCGFRLRDRLPVTYPHVLAFPLQVELMAGRSFPYPLPGLVHVRNRITQHRPLTADEALSVEVWAGSLRPHPKGRQFDLVSEVRVGEEVAWESVSTYLKRGEGGSSDAEAGGAVPDEVPSGGTPPMAEWKVPADTGRRYGAVSGDRNPIHLHPLTAKAFGFPRQIAHGMWTKARCLAALESELPDAYRVEVAFKKPVILPATVAFHTTRDGDRWEFGLEDARKAVPHLVGVVD